MIAPIYVDLFSGIGGASLAADACGYHVAAHAEIDPFCSKVLHKHWPDTPNLGDIHGITAESFRGLGRIDLFHASPPCQSLSVAGKQEAEADPRYLWPQTRRVLAELADTDLKPAWVSIENVAGAVALVLDDWLTDLAGIGYTTVALVLPAAAVEAPHLRERLFVVAHADETRCHPRARRRARAITDAGIQLQDGASVGSSDDVGSRAGTVADPTCSFQPEQSTSNGSHPTMVGSLVGADGGTGTGRTTARVCRCGGTDAGSTAAVEYASGSGCQERDTPAEPSSAGHIAGRCDTGVGQADAPRFGCQWSGSSRNRRHGPENCRCSGGQGIRDYRPAQRQLGRDADGVPRELDLAGLMAHGWPALAGLLQYNYEPPRIVAFKDGDRRSRLRALGNAVVPQQIAPIFAAVHEQIALEEAS